MSSSASCSSSALFSQTWQQSRHCLRLLLKSRYSTSGPLLPANPTVANSRIHFGTTVLLTCSPRPPLSVPNCIKSRIRRSLATMTASNASTTPTAVPMDTRSARVQVLSSKVEKPELDDRSYRLIRLGDNQLEALLVHDPKTDKSSAAMDVHVGHLSDPKDFPGLAHALEHCLFLGTRFRIQSCLTSHRYQKIS